MIQKNTPYKDWGKLYEAVQHSGLFKDSKKFADATTDTDPKELLLAYEEASSMPDFSLEGFVKKHFTFFEYEEETIKRLPIEEHIDKLWQRLSRPADPKDYSSKIPLPYPYIVPGGRFNEIYYWDSYFTMQGLVLAGREDMIMNMLDNFDWMIQHIGFIPNGNRSYFMSRSQPPFFVMMVEIGVANGICTWAKYIDSIEQEYQYWTDASSYSTNYTVEVFGYKLHRYADRWNEPRDESFLEDLELSQITENENLYLHLRSACESGWDFSSRWLEDPHDLSSIKTMNVIPVDLNCLLYKYESCLATFHRDLDSVKYKKYLDSASQRKEAIQTLCFDELKGYYYDLNLDGTRRIHRNTLAGILPLFTKIATQDQAERCANFIVKHFLKDGGVLTTDIHSGQQWDAPNGWAPLQYMTVIGLQNFGRSSLAKDIAHKWCHLNEKVYDATGKMMEKYNVEDISLLGGGGEYPNQDGFGWTNGVYLALKNYIKAED